MKFYKKFKMKKLKYILNNGKFKNYKHFYKNLFI